MNNINTRKCGDCSACCTGALSGTVYGYTYYKGRKCHFLGSSGCSIYEDRPENPCKSFECNWLIDLNIPEWMKPNESGVILLNKTYLDFEYLMVVETDIKLKAEILSWLFMEYLNDRIGNFVYELNGGLNYVGSNMFIIALMMRDKEMLK